MKKTTGATPLFQLEPSLISMFQWGILFFTFVISTIDIFPPHLTAQRAGRDSWISVLMAVLWSLPITATATALALRFPRRSLIEYSHMVLGLWPGRLAGLLYIFFILVFGAITVRELEEIMSITFFQQTPKIVFGAVTILLSTYLTWNGMETIGRVNGILMPIGIFFLILVGLSVFPRADLSNYLPVLENGLKPAVSGSLLLVAFLMEGLVLVSILPLTIQPVKVITATAVVLLALGSALLLGTISIPVLGLQVTARELMPALELSRLIEVPGFSRLDILIMAGWYTGIFVKISVLHYLLVVLTAQWAGLRNYRSLIAPFGVIIVALSFLLFSNTNELVHTIGGPLVYLFLFFEFVFPLIVLITSWLRGIEEKEG
ncbi:MAG: spore germination protein [Peptococcaceae bacterium]|nr:spore germination protein [Peptococcaceae bacterium]